MNVSIPSTRLIESEGFTVYHLRVVYKETNQIVNRRYSEFFELYRKLRKVVKPHPDFPSKRWIKKTDPKVVEYRRKGLESYIQDLAGLKPDHELVLKFLNLRKPIKESASLVFQGANEVVADQMDGQVAVKRCSHVPLVYFSTDDVRQTNEVSNGFAHRFDMAEVDGGRTLPDIVLGGIIVGLENMT
eukprot:m.90983 g.90983  ORF g.90983 m.90983 type:complete len:187 (+) comp36673_c0_seq14:64-624(+)